MKNKRIKEGYIYIISNKSFPDYFKVGVTVDIQSRLRTYQTSDPKRQYKVEYYIFHPEAYIAEKKIKDSMNHFAKEIRGEWYNTSLEFAKSRLHEALESYNNGEWNERIIS